jgi:hypothetical protein
MSDFGPAPEIGSEPMSVKIRVASGCFHREHSPEAYRLIDDYVRRQRPGKERIKIEEHESGPEVLAYIAATTAGLAFTKSVIDLVVAIVKARSEGIRRGDGPHHDLELIVRRFDKKGEYAEEKIMRISSSEAIDAKKLADALNKSPIPIESAKPVKKKREKSG